MEAGSWWLEAGGWTLEAGAWRLDAGFGRARGESGWELLAWVWWLEARSWKLRLQAGGWELEAKSFASAVECSAGAMVAFYLVLSHTASKHKKNSRTSQTYPETPQQLENWVGFGAQKWDPKNVPKMPPSLMSSTVVFLILRLHTSPVVSENLLCRECQFLVIKSRIQARNPNFLWRHFDLRPQSRYVAAPKNVNSRSQKWGQKNVCIFDPYERPPLLILDFT